MSSHIGFKKVYIQGCNRASSEEALLERGKQVECNCALNGLKMEDQNTQKKYPYAKQV